MSRQAERAARRAEISGTGPAQTDHRPGRWPGAAGRFALFGEVLSVGLLVCALSVPLVTAPLAFAVGTRHLRRYVGGESSGLALVGRDLRRGVVRALPVGLGAAAVVAVLVVDLAVARDGVLPGAGLVAAIGWLGLVLVALALLTAARLWSPERGWLVAFRGCWPSWRGDPVGVCYLLVAVVLVAMLGWQLVPLVVPGAGCLILALVAIPERNAPV